mmetsp:Transcript_8160/g.18914  ORF Transcript_8160/g.18914 Transcript_8160/m.18914 type:complete len:206 (-) Transcript_8160:282-899(-)
MVVVGTILQDLSGVLSGQGSSSEQHLQEIGNYIAATVTCVHGEREPVRPHAAEDTNVANEGCAHVQRLVGLGELDVDIQAPEVQGQIPVHVATVPDVAVRRLGNDGSAHAHGSSGGVAHFRAAEGIDDAVGVGGLGDLGWARTGGVAGSAVDSKMLQLVDEAPDHDVSKVHIQSLRVALHLVGKLAKPAIVIDVQGNIFQERHRP